MDLLLIFVFCLLIGSLRIFRGLFFPAPFFYEGSFFFPRFDGFRLIFLFNIIEISILPSMVFSGLNLFFFFFEDVSGFDFSYFIFDPCSNRIPIPIGNCNYGFFWAWFAVMIEFAIVSLYTCWFLLLGDFTFLFLFF